jgi:Fe2+ transport system protein FeoA
MEDSKTSALSRVEEGRTVTVVSVHGGRGLRSRLTALGLLPRVQITVVHNGRFGPFVISIKNSRIAIGKGVADKIMVM